MECKAKGKHTALQITIHREGFTMRKTYAYNSIIIGFLVGLLVGVSTNSVVLAVLAGLGVAVVGFIVIRLIENAISAGADKLADKATDAYRKHKEQKAIQNGTFVQPTTTQMPGAAQAQQHTTFPQQQTTFPQQTAASQQQHTTFPQQPAAPQQTVACPSCGTQVRADARFCPVCGGDMKKTPAPVVEKPAEQMTTCPYCGAQIRASAKFCPSCGSAMKQ